MPKSKKWFTARAADGVAKIMINGVIGSDSVPDWFNEDMGRKNSRAFINAVEAFGDVDEIHLDINTAGGDVASGIAIYNYLKNHKATVTTRVIGRAASIGSIIMLSGDKRAMGAGTSVMAHGPGAYLDGIYNAAEIEAIGEGIKHIAGLLASIYALETNMDADEIAGILAKGDHYFTAEQALEKGFATELDAELQAVACAEPDDFRAELKVQAHIQELETENTSLKTQFDDIQAKHEATLAELDALRNPAAAGADYVIEACDRAQLPALAVAIIKEKLPEVVVTERLTMAARVRDMLTAAGVEQVEADAVIAKVGNTTEMMQALMVTMKAAGDQDLNSHHTNQTPSHADSWSAAFSKTTK